MGTPRFGKIHHYFATILVVFTVLLLSACGGDSGDGDDGGGGGGGGGGPTIPPLESTTWNLQQVNPDFTHVTHGGGVYLVAGSEGMMAVSADAATWAFNWTGTTFNFNNLAFGGGKFLAIDVYEAVFSSTDGSNWTKITDIPNAQCDLFQKYELIHDGSQFIWVGSDGMCTSVNGTTWTQISTTPFRSISYHPTLGYLLTSKTDSVVWTGSNLASLTQTDLTPGTSTFSIVSSVAGIPSGGTDPIWVLVGSVNSVFASSAFAYDGVSVLTGSSLPTDTFYSVAYDNGTFVAVGIGGVIYTSSDGQDWTAKVSGTTNNLRGIVHGTSGFVAAGNFRTITTSVDGASWSFETGDGPRSFGDVEWDSTLNLFFAGTDTGISTSPDGIAWTEVLATPAIVTSAVLGPGHWGVNSGAVFYTTTTSPSAGWRKTQSDAIRLESIIRVDSGGTPEYLLLDSTSVLSTLYSGTDPGSALTAVTIDAIDSEDIAFNGSSGTPIYVVVGASGAIRYSTDRLTWLAASTVPTTLKLRAVTYGNGTFVAVGDEFTRLYSTDGNTWSDASNLSVSGGYFDVIYDGTQFVTVGDSMAMATSPDGVTWTSVTTTTLSKIDSDLRAIAYDGSSVYVAVGILHNRYWSNNIADTTAWNDVSDCYVSCLLSSDNYYDVAWSPSRNEFVAVGYLNGSNTLISTSADGTAWSDTNDSSGRGALAVEASGAEVVIGNGGNLTTLASDNTKTLVNLGNSATLKFLNGNFIAVGGKWIFHSTDGIQWTWKNLESLLGPYDDLQDITFGGGQYLIGAESRSLLSNDLVNWTPYPLPAGTSNLEYLYKVGFGGGMFVTSGNSITRMNYSADGMTWTNVSLDYESFNPSRIIYDGGQFLVVFREGVLVSQDGQTWTGYDSGEVPLLRSVAFDGSKYLGVGGLGLRTTHAATFP